MDYSFKFTQKVSTYIEKNQMIKQGDSVIVGLSGGGDSVCLFLVLNELRKKMKFDLFCVHVNHGIRGISATRDELFAKELCNRENIPIKIYNIDVPKIAKDEKISLEEAGRKARYEIFNQEAKEHNNAKIAVAHHINDQAETILFNMIRGSGLKGMGGITPIRGNIIRPFLSVTRNEIERYLRENNEDFCVDETNEDDTYSRNQIRNKVIPLLNEIQPESVVHIASAAEEFRELSEYIEEKAKELFKCYVTKMDNGYVISLDKLKKEKPIIVRSVIILTMKKLTDEYKDITRTHINDIYSLVHKGRGKEIHLPKGLYAQKISGGIYISKNV